MIFVLNTETNDVQTITSEPNKDNFRIVEMHPNANPKLFAVVISNGSEQGPVEFRFGIFGGCEGTHKIERNPQHFLAS